MYAAGAYVAPDALGDRIDVRRIRERELEEERVVDEFADDVVQLRWERDDLFGDVLLDDAGRYARLVLAQDRQGVISKLLTCLHFELEGKDRVPHSLGRRLVRDVALVAICTRC